MAIIDLLFGETLTTIVPISDDGLTLDTDEQEEIDCVTNESPNNQAEPTELPIEDGADVTDHVKLHATDLALTIIHSNSTFDILDPVQDPFRAKDFYEKLLGWQSDKRLLVVITPHRLYNNMVLVGLPPSWDAGNTDAFAGTLIFKEIRRVSTQIVDLPKTAGTGPKKNLGAKKMKPASPAKKVSALKALSLWSTGG